MGSPSTNKPPATVTLPRQTHLTLDPDTLPASVARGPQAFIITFALLPASQQSGHPQSQLVKGKCLLGSSGFINRCLSQLFRHKRLITQQHTHTRPVRQTRDSCGKNSFTGLSEQQNHPSKYRTGKGDKICSPGSKGSRAGTEKNRALPFTSQTLAGPIALNLHPSIQPVLGYLLQPSQSGLSVFYPVSH